MKSVMLILVSLALPAILAGCATGKSGGPPNAPAGRETATDTLPACGGDIVGRWTIVSSDVKVDVARPECPTATATGHGLTMAGEAQYNTDGTYTHHISMVGSITFNVPSSCMPANSTCTDLAGKFPRSVFQASSCTTVGSVCSCLVTYEPKTPSYSGTYTVPSVGRLLRIPAGEPDVRVTDFYCVEGTTMTIREERSPAPFISGPIVFKKQ
jgi:hypothetical protein